MCSMSLIIWHFIGPQFNTFYSLNVNKILIRNLWLCEINVILKQLIFPG